MEEKIPENHIIIADWLEQRQMWMVGVYHGGIAPITRAINKDKEIAKKEAIDRFIAYKKL